MTDVQPGPKDDVKTTWTWGSSASVILNTAAGVRGAQLAQVTLPEPAVCTVFFQVSCIRPIGVESIRRFTLNMNIGLGRVVATRRITYLQQPSPPTQLGAENGKPLEVTFPFVPMQTLNIDFSADATIGEGSDPGDNEIELAVVLQVAPITKIPIDVANPMEFGMAEPGEADSLDDALLQELEPDAPDFAHEAVENLVVETEGEEVTPERLRIRSAIHQLARRYGRKPTRREVEAALARMNLRSERRTR